MVNISDDCCCEDKALKEQIKDRALSSINKIYTTDDRTYYPDGTGMVTVPLPTQAQLNQIETNKQDIAALDEEMDGIVAEIQEGDAALDAKIDAVDATLSEAIAANVAEIATVDKAVDELSEKVAAAIPTEYRLYRTGEGKIQLQAETADGTLIDSNTLDMVIPYQYDLIAGTTDRSFKIRITLSNGTSYDTNDFIIPTPGDAPVEVTGIIMSKDPDNVNRFKVGVNLSDGSMIETGYVTFVDSVEATVAGNKLTVAVNDVESVPTNVVTSVETDYSDSVLTVAVNGVSDSVTIEGGSASENNDNLHIYIDTYTAALTNEDGSDIILSSSGTTKKATAYNGYLSNYVTTTGASAAIYCAYPFYISHYGTVPSSISTSELVMDDSTLGAKKADLLKSLIFIKTNLPFPAIITFNVMLVLSTQEFDPSNFNCGAFNETISYDTETGEFIIPDNLSNKFSLQNTGSAKTVYCRALVIDEVDNYRRKFIVKQKYKSYIITNT